MYCLCLQVLFISAPSPSLALVASNHLPPFLPRSTAMAQNTQVLWVKYIGHPVKIPKQDLIDVADLIDAVKAKLSKKLGNVDSDDIILHTSEDAVPLHSGTLIAELHQQPGYVENTCNTSLIVKTSVPTIVAPFREVRYKKLKLLSVEASCSKYLDVLAIRFAQLYSFPWTYDKWSTIGDVLKAKDGVQGEDCSFIPASKSHSTFDSKGLPKFIEKGQPRVDIPLPQFYTPDEWVKLNKFWVKISKFNFDIRQLVHDKALPMDSRGRAYIVIPHSDFTPEMIAFLREIGVRATLFSRPEYLDVKDESVLS